LTSVLTDVVSELAYLVQTEIRLAKTEMSEKISTVASGATLLGVAAVMLLAGLFVLLLGGVRWLAIAGVPEQWGFLIVGGAVFVIGGALAWKGANSFKGSAFVPNRTIAQVRSDISVVKEQVR
jgi:uncharacterized membrane protein YqjE